MSACVQQSVGYNVVHFTQTAAMLATRGHCDRGSEAYGSPRQTLNSAPNLRPVQQKGQQTGYAYLSEIDPVRSARVVGALDFGRVATVSKPSAGRPVGHDRPLLSPFPFVNDVAIKQGCPRKPSRRRSMRHDTPLDDSSDVVSDKAPRL